MVIFGLTESRTRTVLKENAHVGQLTGTPDYSNPKIKRVYDYFSKRGCKFGSSRGGEITVRSEDDRYTVYIGRRANGNWRVIRRASKLDKEFYSFDDLTKALQGWGF